MICHCLLCHAFFKCFNLSFSNLRAFISFQTRKTFHEISLFAPQCGGVILVWAFIKKKFFLAQKGTTNDKLFRERRDKKKQIFLISKRMHIVKIDKLCSYLERNLQVIIE